MKKKNKKAWENLVKMVLGNHVYFPKCESLIKELQAFQFKKLNDTLYVPADYLPPEENTTYAVDKKSLDMTAENLKKIQQALFIRDVVRAGDRIRNKSNNDMTKAAAQLFCYCEAVYCGYRNN